MSRKEQYPGGVKLTAKENFKAIDKHREDEDRTIISDWVNLNGPEYCRKQVEAIWEQGG